MKKKTRLNYQDREILYSKLLKESGLLEKSKQSKTEVDKFVVYLYKKYIISEEERRIFGGAKNLINITAHVRIRYQDIWPEMLSNQYPCGDLYRLDFVKGKNRYTTVDYFITVYNKDNDPDLDLILPNIEDYRNISKDYILPRIPEKELETLKNLLIEYFNSRYDITNYLIDYIVNGEFIGNINTISQLRYFNSEWAKKLEEIFDNKENELKDREEQNEVIEFPKSDIPICIDNLKEILEGRKLLDKMPRLL